MATFELILLLGVAVLISSVLDQIVPRISLPLIQIGLGVLISFLAISPLDINIEPDLFLILFIAPLLFSDALEADKKSLWDNKVPILWYAIGLVLLITLCVGFVMHWLIPSIPLAAAFALGAALGPTDAVAVQALRGVAQLRKRESSLLQGEALLNDASGVVSFQFAIAAAVTGVFSLANATVSLIFSFFGGILFGIAAAAVLLFISNKIHDLGLDNITFHVLFEVSMPFIVFLASELLGVSGILAVVACGIVWSMYNRRKISPYRSRLNIALSSVWKVLAFTLNGVVFVLLGMQLPMAMQTTWDDVYINNVELIGYVLIATLLIVGLRFVWSLAIIRFTKNPKTGKRDRLSKQSLRYALVTTISGAKGAITLSIVLSIPFFLADGTTFPQRFLIIFLASGVILCTLLLANFLLPIIAPKETNEDEEDIEALFRVRIEVFRDVIDRLLADSDDENDRETKMVVQSYNNRIATIRDKVDIEPPSSIKLRIEVINHQATRLIEAAENDEIDSYACFTYLRRLMRQKNLLAHEKNSLFSIQMYLGRINTVFHVIKQNILETIKGEDDSLNQEGMRLVRVKSEEYALEYLRGLVDNPNYPSEIVAKLIISHEQMYAMLSPDTDSSVSSSVIGAEERLYAIMRKGMQLELEVIQDYYASGQLTRLQAKEMRDNVSLMMIDLEDHI